jgi:hypothetical protein
MWSYLLALIFLFHRRVAEDAEMPCPTIRRLF